MPIGSASFAVAQRGRYVQSDWKQGAILAPQVGFKARYLTGRHRTDNFSVGFQPAPPMLARPFPSMPQIFCNSPIRRTPSSGPLRAGQQIVLCSRLRWQRDIQAIARRLDSHIGQMSIESHRDNNGAPRNQEYLSVDLQRSGSLVALGGIVGQQTCMATAAQGFRSRSSGRSQS